MIPVSHFYGFATFLLSGYSGQPTDGHPDYGTIWGHLGATCAAPSLSHARLLSMPFSSHPSLHTLLFADGYNSIVEYNAALNVSLAVATNVETDYQAQPSDAFCLAYNKVKQLLLGQPAEAANCSYIADGYYGKCVCATTRYHCAQGSGSHKRCYPSAKGSLTYEECSATCDPHDADL